MVGTHAGDMIGEIALAIEMGADAVDIGKTIHPHPSLGESIGMAAEVGISEVGIYWKLKPAQIARLTPTGIPQPLNMRRVKSTSTPNPDGDHAKDGSLHISFPRKNCRIV